MLKIILDSLNFENELEFILSSKKTKVIFDMRIMIVFNFKKYLIEIKNEKFTCVHYKEFKLINIGKGISISLENSNKNLYEFIEKTFKIRETKFESPSLNIFNSKSFILEPSISRYLYAFESDLSGYYKGTKFFQNANYRSFDQGMLG